ncbi:hypothetical protein EYR40_004734 [Pleurotus pulmonarius]|nr:hypothetical protein EYR36_004114 [Pleurotus pulmonarius]KAF4605942.1 hypothetical protein EYR40_004734 [Pleurotus pulmonarius]
MPTNTATVDALAEIPAALAAAQLIPDVLPPSPSFTPSVLFSVVWPSGKQAHLGNELTRDDTLDEPDIVFAGVGVGEGGSDDERRYTLVMCDPDAPSRAEPKYKEFRHWVRNEVLAPSRDTESGTKRSDWEGWWRAAKRGGDTRRRQESSGDDEMAQQCVVEGVYPRVRQRARWNTYDCETITAAAQLGVSKASVRTSFSSDLLVDPRTKSVSNEVMWSGLPANEHNREFWTLGIVSSTLGDFTATLALESEDGMAREFGSEPKRW